MRQGRLWQRLGRVASAALLTAASGLVPLPAAAVETAEPLEVPTGPPSGPDRWIGTRPDVRLELAANDWLDHGHQQLPLLAWAALTLARQQDRPELTRHAIEWAPGSPGVHFEVGALTGDPRAFARALRVVPKSFPAVIWLGSFALGATGVGCLAAILLVALLAFLRTIPLLGHAIGHLWSSSPTAAWPGALALVCVICTVPILGGGPVLTAVLMAAVALPFLKRGETLAVVVLSLVVTLLLGPTLDRGAALSAVPGANPALLAAWRIEREQPLPGDRVLLERRVASGVASPVEHVALASGLMREGNLDAADRILRGLAPTRDRGLGASAATIRGSVQLSRGRVHAAIESFSQARTYRDSAAVLYNLSQAHSRALNLEEQSRLFAAARRADSELIRQATAHPGTNVHRYLLPVPVPVGAYVSQALGGGPEARALAREVRVRALGTAVPDWGWMALPAILTLGLLRRARSIRRCDRCYRTVCVRCTPESSGATCMRCRRLATADEAVDPRMRRRERSRDRTRQRILSHLLALLGLTLPGSAEILEGRAVFGTVALSLVLLGAGSLLFARLLPGSVDVGGLAFWLPTAIAVLLLLPAYVLGWAHAISRWTTGSRA